MAVRPARRTRGQTAPCTHATLPNDGSNCEAAKGRGPRKVSLEAAWQELLAVGYVNFTYEGVIKRVGTSRTVLYRRWPTKLQLVMAAALDYQGAHPIIVPDLGNVRDELCLALRKVARRPAGERENLQAGR